MVNQPRVTGKVKKRIINSSSDEEDTRPLSKRTKPGSDVAAESYAYASTTTEPERRSTSTAALLAAAQAEPESSDDDVPIAESSQLASPANNKIKDVAPRNRQSTGETRTNGASNGHTATKGNGSSRSSRVKTKPTPGPDGKAPPGPPSDSDDAPISRAARPPPKKRVKREENGDLDGDSEGTKPKKPRASDGTAKAPAKGATQKRKQVKKEDGSSDEAIADKPPAKAVKIGSSAATAKTSKAKAAQVKKEEEASADESEDDEFKWWEQQKEDDTKKWDSLRHNGVLFPPPYVPLPKHVKMKYNGKPVDLPPESEEVAGFYAVMLQTDHVQKPVFRENFFKDFRDVLKQYPPCDGTAINDFDKCDFQPMYDYFELEREKKKQMTREQKKAAKAEKDALEEPYQYCWLDGRKEKVGNFRVEPPSLFRGRGEHPKTGMLKRRIDPEQITINCGESDPVPPAPEGHSWGKVIHNDKASWLAMWKENINGAFKYVFLAAGSSLKGQSDLKKFEKARNLKDHIDRIRRDYTKELTDKVMATRQRATAMYLIDRYALRAGNEKGEDEADTVGCCSLRYEHVTLEPPNFVTFDFLGKDSIRFFQKYTVDEQVFKNLKIFKKEPKTVGDMIFDRLTTALLNKHLADYMPGLSAKVFRTYNASWTFERQLEGTPENGTVAEKILAYNRANREVAVLCNHQRTVSKGHHLAMEKAFDKIRALKYQRRRLRWQLHHAEGYSKKKYKAYDEEESDLEDEWIVQHEEDLVAKERDKIKKKFEKDNAKREEEKEKPMKPKELEERLQAADELETKLRSERKAKKVEGRGDADKVAQAIAKMDERIATAKTAATDRDEGKETSLGTSKINYIDPRLTYAWCAKYGVPVEKMFSKTLREKFTWAAATPADFTF